LLTAGIFGLLFIVPFAFIGLVHFWCSNRLYFYVLTYVIAIWPLAHAPFDFANYRYILPPLLLVFLLAAVGASSLLRGLRQSGSKWRAGFVYWCLAVIVLAFMIGSGSVLNDSPNRVAETDQGIAREFQPAVEAFEDQSLLVSAVTGPFRAVYQNISYLELVDHHKTWGTDEESLTVLTDTIRKALAAGHPVYYLYSHWEAGHDFLGNHGKENYARFFEAINGEFALVFMQQSEGKRAGLHPWTLYRVEIASDPTDALQTAK
jgi:hypothetical protein